MARDDGGQAFAGPRTSRLEHGGMSLRDYFAAQAMTAMNEDLSVEDIARKSYELADAMLKERMR